MKRILLMVITLVATALFIASCQYKFTVEPVIVPPDPDDTVSFATDIIPIWDVENNCATCHDGQIHSLNLTPDAAYAQITSKGLINSEIPEESIIYAYPAPNSGSHSWSKYKAANMPVLLLWIEQGALNN